MDWFKSYHGAPFDPKLAVVAKRAGRPRGEIVAVWWAVLDYASRNAETRGNARNADAEEIAIAFDFNTEDVLTILQAMRERGMIETDGTVSAWEKRQSGQGGTSTERVRRYRERVKQNETVSETAGNAETTEEKRVEEKDIPPKAPRKRGGVLDSETLAKFEAWYAVYPRHVARQPAERAFVAALKLVPLETLTAGARRYADEVAHREPEKIAHPATWLNARRWEDEPARVAVAAVDPDAGHRARIAEALKRGKWFPNFGPAPWEDSYPAKHLLAEFSADQIEALKPWRKGAAA